MGKSGRRVQANARTLSYAVRQYFRPALREIQPAAAAENGNSLLQESEASTSRTALVNGPPSPTPDDQLIPTQPDYPGPSQQPSEKSLGKRKRIENDKGEDEEQENSRTTKSTTDVQTRFTQSNIPPALKKCVCTFPLVRVHFLRGVHGTDSWKFSCSVLQTGINATVSFHDMMKAYRWIMTVCTSDIQLL